MTNNNVHHSSREPRSAHRPLTERSVRDLHDIYARTRDPRIRADLVEAHRGLVWYVANRCGDLGVDVDDLFSYGVEGLMRAIEGFDPLRGFTFSTYAYKFIRGQILHGVDQERGGPRGRRFKLESLDASRRNDDSEEGTTLGDREKDENAPDPEAILIAKMNQNDVIAHVAALPAEQRNVVVLRFGLKGGDPMTNNAIARSLGITGEKVRTLEARAMAHLRAVDAAARPAA